MAGDPMEGALRVPERLLRVPRHLSEEAQAFLSRPMFPRNSYPALDDKQAWRELIAGSDAMLTQMFAGRFEPHAFAVETLQEGEATGFDIRPTGWSASDRRVYLYIHGGALIMGSGEVCKIMSMSAAREVGARTIAADYRMPPDHPFPVGLDDCVAFYRMVLRDHAPTEIVVGGASAGGNLVVAMLLKARDEGLPMPAGAVIQTPEVDLTESGDSFQVNAGIDGMGTLMQPNLLYANGADLTDPYVSPLFGDFTKGFPPSIVSAGTRDLFLSNAVRLHRKLRSAGIPAELHIVEAAVHGAFGGAAAEDAELSAETRTFCDRCWSGAYAKP